MTSTIMFIVTILMIGTRKNNYCLCPPPPPPPSHPHPHSPPYFKFGMEGGNIVSPLSICTSVLYENGFHTLSFEKLLYWIHNHKRQVKFVSLIWGKIHSLFWELWRFFIFIFAWKMVAINYLLKNKILLYQIHIFYTGI